MSSVQPLPTSRSMLEILIELSSRIELPETHVNEGRAAPTFSGDEAKTHGLPLSYSGSKRQGRT